MKIIHSGPSHASKLGHPSRFPITQVSMASFLFLVWRSSFSWFEQFNHRLCPVFYCESIRYPSHYGLIITNTLSPETVSANLLQSELPFGHEQGGRLPAITLHLRSISDCISAISKREYCLITLLRSISLLGSVHRN